MATTPEMLWENDLDRYIKVHEVGLPLFEIACRQWRCRIHQFKGKREDTENNADIMLTDVAQDLDWRAMISHETRKRLTQKMCVPHLQSQQLLSSSSVFLFLSLSSPVSAVDLRECVTEGASTDASRESLAARFEDNAYREAKSKEDYFHKISNKMYNLKLKKAVPLPDTAASPAVPTFATVAAQPPLPVVAAPRTTPGPPQAATTKPLELAAPRHGVVGQPRTSPQSPSFFLWAA